MLASITVSASRERRCAMLQMAVIYLRCRDMATRKHSSALRLSLLPL